MKNKQLLFLVLANFFFSLLTWFNFSKENIFLQPLLSLITFIVLPGLIIINLFQVKDWLVSKKIVFSIPLGLAHFTFFGFIYNLYIQKINPKESLLSDNFIITLLITLNIINLVFILLGRKIVSKFSLSFKPKAYHLIYILLSLLPILSITGTILLNNGGTNLLTILVLAIIPVVIILLGIFNYEFTDNVYSLAIFMIALSLLWMYSLRSSHLVGWDIHQEFKVFQITQKNTFWDIGLYKSAYNATLSITLLPTILLNITRISDIYIYKLVYPFLFSIVPVIIFYISKIYIKPYFAFLSAFFFMSQFQFMTQMPALNRQEIAFIYFGLLVYSLFSKSLYGWKRSIVYIISSVLIIVSHYSSAYITAGLLISVYLTTKFYNVFYLSVKRFLSLKYLLEFPKLNSRINIWMVLFFVGFTYLWYGVYANITKDLETFGEKLYSNIAKIHNDELKSEQARYAIWGSKTSEDIPKINTYIEEIGRDYRNTRKWALPFHEADFKNYPVKSVSSEIIIIQNPLVKRLTDILTEFSKKSVKILMLIGVVYLLFRLIRVTNTENYSLDLITLNLSGILFLSAITFLVFFSIYYNFERLYQQALFILGIVMIIGVLVITQYKEKIAKAFLLLLLVIYFLHYSGLTNQLVGGTPSLALNNYGEEYDRFYPHQSELFAAKWLTTYGYPNSSISTDRYGWLKFQSSTNRENGFITEVVNNVIPKYGYVYSSYTNTLNKIARTNYKGTSLNYNFPTEFLENNKNLIYSSNTSKIYK